MKGSAPIRRRGGCRLEAPIEAGRTLYHMRQAGMTTVSLVVIRRQRNAQLRNAWSPPAARSPAETIAVLSEK